MHGIPILGTHDFRPELTISPPSTGDTVDALLHRATLREHDIVIVGQDPVTSPARTVIDLGRSMPTGMAVVAIDHALQHRLATRADLADVLELCHNWPGIRRALRAVQLSDARSESPLESLSRLTIARLHLPPPEPQVTIVDRYGKILGRLDFYWDEPGLGGEADGLSKYAGEDGRDVFRREKDRHEDIEDVRVELARWRWWHVQHPEALRAKIENGFERGRLRDLAGIPRLWTPHPSTRAR